MKEDHYIQTMKVSKIYIHAVTIYTSNINPIIKLNNMQNCHNVHFGLPTKISKLSNENIIQLNLQLIMTIRTSVRIQSFYVFGIAYVLYTTIFSQFNYICVKFASI